MPLRYTTVIFASADRFIFGPGPAYSAITGKVSPKPLLKRTDPSPSPPRSESPPSSSPTYASREFMRRARWAALEAERACIVGRQRAEANLARQLRAERRRRLRFPEEFVNEDDDF